MTRLEQTLLSLMARASADHRLLEPEDRVLVAVSGGKDSLVLLHLLRKLKERAPFRFSLLAVTVDQGQPGFPCGVIEQFYRDQGYEHLVVRDDTYSVVKEKTPPGKSYCSLCSRLRRGILYTTAARLGVTKIALGHHRDDAIETLLLNLFYSGQIKAMPARLRSDDGRHVVIRPLIYCAERDIEVVAKEAAMPVIPCSLCSQQENLKRERMSRLIETLEQENPHVRSNLFAALGNVRPTHLLDRSLSAAAQGTEPEEEHQPR
jgi:tRNA 2-thiocytidine biosynthesis protein TtcA